MFMITLAHLCRRPVLAWAVFYHGSCRKLAPTRKHNFFCNIHSHFIDCSRHLFLCYLVSLNHYLPRITAPTPPPGPFLSSVSCISSAVAEQVPFTCAVHGPCTWGVNRACNCVLLQLLAQRLPATPSIHNLILRYIEVTDTEGTWTALSFAAWEGHIEIVLFFHRLEQHGLPSKKQDFSGSWLMWAVSIYAQQQFIFFFVILPFFSILFNGGHWVVPDWVSRHDNRLQNLQHTNCKGTICTFVYTYITYLYTYMYIYIPASQSPRMYARSIHIARLGCILHSVLLPNNTCKPAV